MRLRNRISVRLSDQHFSQGAELIRAREECVWSWTDLIRNALDYYFDRKSLGKQSLIRELADVPPAKRLTTTALSDRKIGSAKKGKKAHGD